MFYFGYDSTYILVLIGVAICLLASSRVNRVFRKYSSVRSHSGMTGKEAAEKILRANGIYDVQVRHISGNLTDHYDPRNKTLGLSDSTYGSASVAAIGVAAHECGHAVQHATGYMPLQLRGALVPVANFGSAIAWPLILIGLMISSRSAILFIDLGILLFSAAVLFQIVTLPVEFNASHRALATLESRDILSPQELSGAKSVLTAAALTYVAALIQSLAQLLRLLILVNGRRRND